MARLRASAWCVLFVAIVFQGAALAQTKDADWTDPLEEMALKGIPLTPRQKFELGAAYMTLQPARAERWLAEPAELGFAWAQYYLGKVECTLKKFEACAMWLQRAGWQGFTSAGIDLDSLYLDGHGVPKDLKLACMWGLMSGHLDPEEIAPCRTSLSSSEFLSVQATAREIRAREGTFKDFGDQ